MLEEVKDLLHSDHDSNRLCSKISNHKIVLSSGLSLNMT